MYIVKSTLVPTHVLVPLPTTEVWVSRGSGFQEPTRIVSTTPSEVLGVQGPSETPVRRTFGEDGTL